jgi:hypothetical protein
VTNRLAIRDAFVMSVLDTVPHTVHLFEETVMIVQAHYHEHISYSAERAASRALHGESPADCDDDDFDGDAAEICRMIELSGMIGLECSVLQGA